MADVIHYNLPHRVSSELTRRFFGIPAISYFGDFGALLPAAPIAAKWVEAFRRQRSLRCIQIERDISELGPDVAPICLLVDSP